VGHRINKEVVCKGGAGRGVPQCRGRKTDGKPLVRALEESCAWWAEMQGKER